ncbi:MULTISPECIES: DUF2273 domain-containing protein [Bacillaceae]|uniref:DUF2273 domain-containing protein n=1 Tax=Bacillaceae TaxID=186817 RepID=UPI00104564D8|nr:MULTISPECIES: DUF2273 domain-containing protein [Bacillaceae]MDT2046312.1 DUF2273 domain-containing protein [Priestia flexa]TDB50004.1 DUF2273 domain-containing protein [Bacillus sp. CBEL-1]USY53666.1 DUF2273 domain-containing protein [Bacillus sp. 1780r2a1]
MSGLDKLLPYRGRLFGLLLGLILAILLLTIGFGPTILVIGFMGIGYLIGKWRDGQLDIEAWLRFFTRRP